MATITNQDSKTDLVEVNNNVESQERVVHRVGSAGNTSTWRLVLLSSKIRQSSVLSSATRSGVRILSYKYDSTTLESLLGQVQQTLGEKRLESIAFIANGQQATLQLCASGEQVCDIDNLCFIYFLFHFLLLIYQDDLFGLHFIELCCNPCKIEYICYMYVNLHNE